MPDGARKEGEKKEGEKREGDAPKKSVKKPDGAREGEKKFDKDGKPRKEGEEKKREEEK